MQPTPWAASIARKTKHQGSQDTNIWRGLYMNPVLGFIPVTECGSRRNTYLQSTWWRVNIRLMRTRRLSSQASCAANATQPVIRPITFVQISFPNLQTYVHAHRTPLSSRRTGCYWLTYVSIHRFRVLGLASCIDTFPRTCSNIRIPSYPYLVPFIG